jgi:hypothetical protein
MKEKLVKCWSCDGTGIAGYALHRRDTVTIKCARCKGDKKCPEIMRKWEEEGRAHMKERQRRDLSLRERAAELGCTLPELADAEHGRIDPSTIIKE